VKPKKDTVGEVLLNDHPAVQHEQPLLPPQVKVVGRDAVVVPGAPQHRLFGGRVQLNHQHGVRDREKPRQRRRRRRGKRKSFRPLPAGDLSATIKINYPQLLPS